MKTFVKTLAIAVALSLSCFCFVACSIEMPPEKHKFCEWYVSVHETCNENGEMRRDCTMCKYYETKVIEASGHEIVHQEAQNPTHIEVGYKDYEYCTKCDYTTREDIPEIPHEFTVEVIAPTCTERGYTIYTCECGFEKIDNYVDELGHVYQVECNPATCEEDGIANYTCDCGDTYQEVLPATGHKAGNWIIDQQPTNETEGSMHKECEYCHEIMEESTISPIE